MNKAIFCEKSGAVAIKAVEPAKGAITRLEFVIGLAELAMNPAEIVKESMWEIIKARAFKWLRAKDKSTYRPH